MLMLAWIFVLVSEDSMGLSIQMVVFILTAQIVLNDWQLQPDFGTF